jgi:hypothetical protein
VHVRPRAAQRATHPFHFRRHVGRDDMETVMTEAAWCGSLRLGGI